jgi:hypothetical protein
MNPKLIIPLILIIKKQIASQLVKLNKRLEVIYQEYNKK